LIQELDKIPFFDGLSDVEKSSVKSLLREKAFDKGEVLFAESAPCERVFFVRTGRVKIYRMTSAGREQILEVLGPGDTCACNPGLGVWACTATAEALSPVKVFYLPRDRYVKLVQENNELSHTLNRIFAEKLRCFSSLIEEVSLKDAKRRVIKFLLDMMAEKPSRALNKEVLFISFTQEELAQRVGTARETVARHLHDLKRKGLIDIKPHQISILDKQGLEKLLAG